MSWRRRLFDLVYRLRMPVWDIPTPPEVRDLIEGEAPLPTGRVLDLGCGTGTNVVYLAQHGWEAVGVDFSAHAIQQARRKASGMAGAAFVEADITKLRGHSIRGPFDLVLDTGCYDTLPLEVRQAYVEEVAAVMRPGALLLMWEVAGRLANLPGVPSVQTNEIAERFGREFVIECVKEREFVQQRGKRGQWRFPASWYWLRKR